MNLDPSTPQGAAAIAAISGAIKDKDQKTAKQTLRDCSTHPIDLSIRLVGMVTKGASSPSTGGPASVCLINAGVVGEVLRRLKVEPAKLRRMLRSIGHAPDAHDDAAALAAEFDRVAGEIADSLPTVTKPGRAGSVRAELSLFEVTHENQKGKAA